MSLIALIQSDTFDGDTTIVDAIGNTVNKYSGPSHDTWTAKWGASSIELSSYLEGFETIVPGPIVSNDFTIDFWFYYYDQDSGWLSLQTDLYMLKQNGTDLELWDSNALRSIKVDLATFAPQDQWNHIGLSFGSDGSSTARLYINGVLAGDDSGAAWTSWNLINDTDVYFKFGHATDARQRLYLDELAVHEGELIDFSVTGVPTSQYDTPTISDLDGLVDFALGGVINAERDIYEFNTGGLVDFELAGSMSATSYSQVVLSGNPITFVVDGGFTLGKNQISGFIDFVVAGEINVQTEDATGIAGLIDFALGGNINAESSSYLQLSGSRIDFAVDGYIGIEVDKEMSVVGLVDFAIKGDFSIVNPPEFSLSSSVDFDINGTINAKGSDTCTVSLMPYARSLKC